MADPKTTLMMGCCCTTNVVLCKIVGRPNVLTDLRTCDLEGRSDTQDHGRREWDRGAQLRQVQVQVQVYCRSA